MFTRSLLTLCLLFNASLLFAQRPNDQAEYLFERFRLPRGLDGNHVQAIAQDSLGFMWFGSQSGLHRWDGYEVRTYLHDPSDSTSIADSYVEYLYVGADGTLWVGTWGAGLDRFDYQRQRFEHIDYVEQSVGPPPIEDIDNLGGRWAPQPSLCVTSLVEDDHQQLWIATAGGLFRYDLTTGATQQFLHDPTDPHSLSDDACNVLYFDSQHELYVGTGMVWEARGDGGLNRYRPDTDDFYRYPQAEDSTGLSDNCVTALFEDSRHQFWIGTKANGLHRLDRSTQRFERLGGILSEQSTAEFPRFRHTKFIFEDRDSRLWIGYFLGGITVFDLDTGDTATYHHNRFDPYGLPEPYPWRMLQSNDGTLWALTAGPDGCVSKLVNPIASIHPVPEMLGSVVGYGEARDGDLLMLNASGKLFRYTQRTHRLTASGKLDIGGAEATQIIEGVLGDLWVSANPKVGLVHYDLASKRRTVFNHDPGNAASLAPGVILGTHQDEHGRLWALSNYGYLSLYLPESNSFENFSLLDRPESRMGTDYFAAINGAADGQLWVIGSGSAAEGLSTSVLLFSPETKSVALRADIAYFTKRLSKFEHVLGSASDSEGNLYLWSERQIASCGPDGKERFVIDADYFGATAFRDLLVDQQRRVWIITDRVLLFDPLTKSFSVIATPNKNNEWAPGTYPLIKMAGGSIFASTSSGILSVDPDKVSGIPRSGPAASMISDFSLIGSARDSLIDPEALPAFDLTRPIHLPHDQNAFSIRIGNPNYQHKEPSRQEFRLDGHEGLWRSAPASGEISYVGLPPGRYVFQVRTANDNGEWGPPASQHIIIASPWWRTWWAYSVYALLIGWVVAAAYRVQLKRRLVTAEAERLRDLEQSRTRLYTNITHEFRTPLTVISGMAAQIEANPQRWLADGLVMINRNTELLLTLVNQLLDLSKLESQRTPVNAKLGDVVAYLRYVLDSVHPLCSIKAIDLHIYAEPPTILMDFDPEKIQQVVVNLLSNAVKFTPENGNIYISIRALQIQDLANHISNRPVLEVQVRDTGVGIPKDQLAHIFDRFYQADDSDTRRAEGTGIGLALVQGLVNLMGGSITVTSQLGRGTEFTLHLPITAQAAAVHPALPLSKPAKVEHAPAEYVAETASPVLVTGKPRVLLIEDNLDVATYVTTILQDDYDLLVGRDGQEGINLAFETIPDLVVTDLMMPRQDGYSVCRALKGEVLTSHVPIIVLTAKADTDSKLAALETGADAFLTKPFSQQELRLRIEKLIEGRSHLRQYYLSMGGQEVPALEEAPSENDRKELRFIQTLRTTVEAHLDDSDFTVEEFCREVSMSSSQLHRKLTALVGLSPVRFIRHVRLNRAKHMLEDPEISIKVVAYETGFSDPSYFSRSFKNQFGMTPIECRDQVLGQERNVEQIG